MPNEKKKTGVGFLVIMKESVSALLALIIILGTLVLLWPALTSSPIDITSAQGIFSILGGWGGVIIGYYFGRLPAERAAARAEAEAVVARQEKDIAERIKLSTLVGSSRRLVDSEMKLAELEKKFEKDRAILQEFLAKLS